MGLVCQWLLLHLARARARLKIRRGGFPFRTSMLAHLTPAIMLPLRASRVSPPAPPATALLRHRRASSTRSARSCSQPHPHNPSCRACISGHCSPPSCRATAPLRHTASPLISRALRACVMSSLVALLAITQGLARAPRGISPLHSSSLASGSGHLCCLLNPFLLSY